MFIKNTKSNIVKWLVVNEWNGEIYCVVDSEHEGKLIIEKIKEEKELIEKAAEEFRRRAEKICELNNATSYYDEYHKFLYTYNDLGVNIESRNKLEELKKEADAKYNALLTPVLDEVLKEFNIEKELIDDYEEEECFHFECKKIAYSSFKFLSEECKTHIACSKNTKVKISD